MTDLQFGRVRAALYDPQYMNRQVTLGALQTLGLTQIEPFARIGDLESSIATTSFDLLVAELQSSEDAVCDLVRRVRHRLIGNNPFIVILLTTWDLNADAVRAVLNSGADDLLARPYTIAQLQQRLAGAAFARKPFVVTADYVGPSRRNSAREPEEGELFDVPNFYRERVLGEAQGPQDIESVWHNVLRWKTIRLGRQLEVWAAQLAKNAIPTGDEAAISSLISRIAETATELASYARSAHGPAYEAVADFCAKIGGLSFKREDAEGEKGLKQFTEFASLIADQVRFAATTDRNNAVGGVPFYIA